MSFKERDSDLYNQVKLIEDNLTPKEWSGKQNDATKTRKDGERHHDHKEDRNEYSLSTSLLPSIHGNHTVSKRIQATNSQRELEHLETANSKAPKRVAANDSHNNSEESSLLSSSRISSRSIHNNIPDIPQKKTDSSKKTASKISDDQRPGDPDGEHDSNNNDEEYSLFSSSLSSSSSVLSSSVLSSSSLLSASSLLSRGSPRSIHNNIPDIPQKKIDSSKKTNNPIQFRLWKAIDEFSTRPSLQYPYGIAMNANGSIAVTDGLSKAARIFVINNITGNKSVKLKGSFNVVDTPKPWKDIDSISSSKAIVPDKRKLLFLVAPGKPLVKDTISCNTKQNPNPKKQNPVTVAVDSKNEKIITGLEDKIILIQNEDGSESQSITTRSAPRYLAVTSKGNIVGSFSDNTLQILSYSRPDSEPRILPPPKKLQKDPWKPQAVCCSKEGDQEGDPEGDIFVVNDGDNSVYHYTADGKKCLGRILREELKPAGIVLNENGRKLYVVIPRESKVKIFERR